MQPTFEKKLFMNQLLSPQFLLIESDEKNQDIVLRLEKLEDLNKVIQMDVQKNNGMLSELRRLMKKL